MMARFMAFPICNYVLDTMERVNWFTLERTVCNSRPAGRSGCCVEAIGAPPWPTCTSNGGESRRVIVYVNADTQEIYTRPRCAGAYDEECTASTWSGCGAGSQKRARLLARLLDVAAVQPATTLVVQLDQAEELFNPDTGP